MIEKDLRVVKIGEKWAMPKCEGLTRALYLKHACIFVVIATCEGRLDLSCFGTIQWNELGMIII